MTIAEQIAELEKDNWAYKTNEAHHAFCAKCADFLFANSRLFAAAEAMRDALKKSRPVVEYLGRSYQDNPSLLRIIDAALALAEPQEQGK